MLLHPCLQVLIVRTQALSILQVSLSVLLELAKGGLELSFEGAMMTSLYVKLSQLMAIYSVKRRAFYCYEDNLYYKSPLDCLRASILEVKSLTVAYICS